MVPRNRARYLAPIALAATITATYLVVHHALSDKTSTAHSPLVRTNARTVKRPPPARQPTFYVVRAGDTLSNISAKTGIPLPTIETLNPNINPNALQTGQRLRLRQ
jgi:LysM repeat protein